MKRFELLCEDEGFIKTVKGYSESNYSFDSYFKGTNFREVDVKKALKLKIWTREEIDGVSSIGESPMATHFLRTYTKESYQ